MRELPRRTARLLARETRRLRSGAVGAAFGLGLLAGVLAMAVSACSMSWMGGAGGSGGGGASAPIASDERTEDGSPIIRVRIMRDERRLEVAGAGEVIVRLDRVGEDETRLATPVGVTLGSAGWTVRGAGGASVALGRSRNPATPLPLRMRSADGEMLRIGTVSLPGEIVLHPDGSGDELAMGRFDVVEHVSIEQYLPGVVAKELLAGWSLEAYRAQAIAARSYALHERQRRMAIGSVFDVESTTQDQAYAGATSGERFHEGVRSTRGLVLTWNGSLLRAYYSSTTGGRAASARDTWPTGPGYEYNLAAPIQASARDDSDSISPLYRWRVERDTQTLTRRFRAFGVDAKSDLATIGSLEAITVAGENIFGRPTRYRIVDSGGRSWTLSAERTRLACNFPGGGEVTRAMRVNSGDFVARVEPDVVVFNGRGFGHGVGMSQYGAEGMARRGLTAEAILDHYYPGSTIERAY